MTTRLHQVVGTTATGVKSITLDKPVLGVSSGYLLRGETATATTPSKAEVVDLAIVTTTPSAEGEIRFTAATNVLELFTQTPTPEAENVMVLEVVEKASVPQP